jgi:hypothetical protein
MAIFSIHAAIFALSGFFLELPPYPDFIAIDQPSRMSIITRTNGSMEINQPRNGGIVISTVLDPLRMQRNMISRDGQIE